MSIRRMFNNAVSIVFTFIKFSIMKLFLGSGYIIMARTGSTHCFRS